MILYLVRHGESEANAEDVHSSGDTPLTRVGREQARKIAARFRHIALDVIFSSDQNRAFDTAEEIKERIRKPHIVSKHLREIRRPSEMQRKSRRDPEMVRIRNLIARNTKKNWHYSDEENFHDFKTRVAKFLKLFQKRKERHALVVSHGGTMRILLGLMLFGERDFSQKMFYRLLDVFKLVNTGLTVCEYKDGDWKIRVWNDHAHLGE